MKCEKIEKLLVLYLTGELSQKKKKKVKEHVEQCPKCS